MQLIAENNGGKTNYYDLPLPDPTKLMEILVKLETKEISKLDAINLILELCPRTLNDLIEYKNMLPFQHEIFKATYALEERADKISKKDIAAGKLREINKIIYYAIRGKNLLL